MHERETKRKSLKLLRMRDLTSEYGLFPATVYRWISKGSFPLPITIGSKTVAWNREEIEEWRRTRPRANIRLLAEEEGAGQGLPASPAK